MMLPSREQVEEHRARIAEDVKGATWLSVGFYVAFLAIMALLVMMCSCCSPTAPQAAPVFPYAGCKMTSSGVDETPQGKLTNVWQDWICTDGAAWRSNSGGTVYRLTVIPGVTP